MLLPRTAEPVKRMLRAIALLGAAGRAFQAPTLGVAASLSQRAAAATSAEMTDVALENPTCRDRDYSDNAVAAYLVDLPRRRRSSTSAAA